MHKKLTVLIDFELLLKQRQYLESLPESDNKDGILQMMDTMVDAFHDTPTHEMLRLYYVLEGNDLSDATLSGATGTRQSQKLPSDDGKGYFVLLDAARKCGLIVHETSTGIPITPLQGQNRITPAHTIRCEQLPESHFVVNDIVQLLGAVYEPYEVAEVMLYLDELPATK